MSTADLVLPRLIAVRHAPVKSARVERCHGATDVLTSIGHDDAAGVVVSRLGDTAVNRVWSSRLSRCTESARRVALEFDLMALDRWGGATWLDEGPPGGESASEFEARVRAWHAELVAGELHLLLAHAGVAQALTVIRQGLTWSEAMKHTVPALTPIEL